MSQSLISSSWTIDGQRVCRRPMLPLGLYQKGKYLSVCSLFPSLIYVLMWRLTPPDSKKNGKSVRETGVQTVLVLGLVYLSGFRYLEQSHILKITELQYGVPPLWCLTGNELETTMCHLRFGQGEEDEGVVYPSTQFLEVSGVPFPPLLL